MGGLAVLTLDQITLMTRRHEAVQAAGRAAGDKAAGQAAAKALEKSAAHRAGGKAQLERAVALGMAAIARRQGM